jgi:hypothetical protein
MAWEIQSTFDKGVLDPKLKGRTDLDLYYGGVETGDNVICLPQGGLTRRNGFEYLSTLAGKSRLFAFEFNTDTTNQYVIAFTSTNWYAYRLSDNTQVATNTHTFSTDIFEADYVQSGDVLILVHKDHAPARLERTGAAAFNFDDISLLNIPQYNYDDASSPVPSAGQVQSFVFTSFAKSDRYRLVLEDFLTAEISYSAITATNETRIQEALLDLPVIDSDPSTVTVAYVSGTTYTITFSGNSADEYKEINAVIVEAVSASAEGTATVTSTGTPPSKKEPVWSAGRGYPKTVAFHEGRLVFGGSLSKPATIWMSFANDFFNFKVGVGRADEAIVATLDTDQLNEIVGLSSNRNLQIFTTGQEFYVPTSPVTPATIVIKPQSAYGSKAIKPQVIDGFSCYVQKSGQALRRFILSEFESSYDSVSVSLLAPALVRDPVDMTVQKGILNIDASYLYLVNDDGSMAVYLSKKEEGINNWSLWTTQGLFQYAVAVGDDLFVCVERTINGATVNYLEKLYSTANKDMFCDAGIRYDQSASATVSGLSHLDGESIRIVADGSVQGDEIPSSGSITLDKDSEYGWAGLNQVPLIKTMPAATTDERGRQIMPLRKRWVRIRPMLYNSLGVYITYDGNEIFLADRQFDVDVLGAAPVQRSGVNQGVRVLGWTYEAQLTITQKDPLPFTILSLSTELG